MTCSCIGALFTIVGIFCSRRAAGEANHSTDMSFPTDRNDTVSTRNDLLGDLCACHPAPACDPSAHSTQQHPSAEHAAGIDIRIVTPPMGLECGDDSAYCCFVDQGATAGCGVRHLNLTASTSSSTRAQDGQSSLGEFPWQALILDVEGGYVGGGAILDPFHVVTAAHRVASLHSFELVVRAGDWNVQSEVEPLGYQETRVTSVTVHPQYQSRSLQYDVAVLTLAQGLRLHEPHVNSVCLPSPDANFTNSKCWVSGWGKDRFGSQGRYQSVLKSVDVAVVEGDECERRLRRTRLGRHFRLDGDSFLCAGGETDKDACTGDGGSPLVCEGGGGAWQLAGLVAWGIGCGRRDVPGVYVNVPALAAWIGGLCGRPGPPVL